MADEGPLRMDGVKGIRTKTIKAGDMLEVEIYPIWNTQGLIGARAARKNVTTKFQAEINYRNAWKKLNRFLNANFTRKDYHITLTYKGKAPNHEEAKRDMQNFIRRVKRLRKKAGLPELKYIYVLEWEDDPEKQQKRIHLHVVMNGGLDRAAVEECWAKGWANADRLQPGDEGLNQLAKYLTKSPKGAKRWSGSRNLKKPVELVSDHKISRRRALAAARALDTDGKAILEKVYPGYQFVQLRAFYPSMECVDGVYLYGIMKKREERSTAGRKKGRCA